MEVDLLFLGLVAVVVVGLGLVEAEPGWFFVTIHLLAFFEASVFLLHFVCLLL